MEATGKEGGTSTLCLVSGMRSLKTVQKEGWEEPQEHGSLHTALKSDLARLIEGKVKCTKPKPPSTKETRKEAFDRYMKIIYRVPYDIKVDFDDGSDEISFEPVANINRPYISTKVEDTPKISVPVVKTNKKKCRKKKHAPANDASSPSEEEPEPVVTPKPVIHEKPVVVKELTTHSNSSAIPPKAPTPPPAPILGPTAPKVLPPREPSPELPEVLREFLDREWFQQLYPEKKSIPSSLSPESFSLQLVDYLCTCNTQFKAEIISALEMLHRRKLLQNTDQLYQKLLETVPKFVTPNMSPNDQAVLGQILNLSMYIKSVHYELVKTLLTLLAYKDLGLREIILRMLKSLGVDEAEQWLCPELDRWDSALHYESNMWESLHNFAECSLTLWTTKYKDYNRDRFLRSTEKWTPPSFTVVDVLNYFCSVQKEEYLKAKQAAPRTKNTVLLPPDCASRPIHRLGETYSMARIRRPPNLILPPLRDRPFLMDFPKFMKLPLPRVNLSPYQMHSEEDGIKFLDHRYYILEKSNIEYYRQKRHFHVKQ